VWPGSVIPAGLIADASVLGGMNSNNNYGQMPFLVTETDAGSASDSSAVTYMKFDLTHAFVAPTSATLKLTLNGPCCACERYRPRAHLRGAGHDLDGGGHHLGECAKLQRRQRHQRKRI